MWRGFLEWALRTSDHATIMLVLSRQRDESIIIGDNIVVTIVDVRGDKVRLGIEAPREVSVHRREVYEAIQRESAPRSARRSGCGGTRDRRPRCSPPTPARDGLPVGQQLQLP